MADDKRMNHDVMRCASLLPVEGGAATDTVAASGGLDTLAAPGGGEAPGCTVAASTPAEPEPIPGELEKNTELPLGHPIGAELAFSDPETTLDEATRRERRWEGGGRVR
jgi:hypothetical protein